MKKRIFIQFKAAFLIIVFSLNTVIGFACALGMKIRFNSQHHQDKEATKPFVHIYANGKKHIHHNEVTKHPVEANNHQKSKDSKDNCCTEQVMKFHQVDKSASHSLNASINPVFFAAFIASYYDLKIFSTSDVVKDIKPFVRSYHPPISDIRIAIQSFQI